MSGGWSRVSIEGNGGSIPAFRSAEGYEVWEDFEWADREWSEDKGQYVGPMKKVPVFLGKTPRGQIVGPFKSMAEAKRRVRD